MLFEFNTNIYDDELQTNKTYEIYDIEEGFTKGNMFKNIYSEYKNYKPGTIKIKNEKEAMLVKLMMLDFAINDLNLYLSLNPQDKETYQLFTKCSLAYNKLQMEYEKKYQVLQVNNDTFGKYSYNSSPWPWEGYYV